MQSICTGASGAHSPLVSRSNIARITEHAALAIGNRRLLAALHGQATTDPRTGLANSRAFDEALEAALAKRTGSQTVSVLMLDIDHFKRFNDRHGHPAGDEALRAFAAVLRACMRDGDLAARYGGEEFAVMLPGADEGIVPAIAERIRARIEATIISLSAGVTDHITVSIGIASAPEHGVDRVTLLRLADEALYRAKDNGRNQVVRVTDRRITRATDKTPAAASALPHCAPGGHAFAGTLDGTTLRRSPPRPDPDRRPGPVVDAWTVNPDNLTRN